MSDVADPRDLPPLPSLDDLVADLGDPGPPDTPDPLTYPVPLTVGTLRRWHSAQHAPRDDT